MPFRFRRSIGPRWLHLVISKTGLSVSAGRPGMHVNYDLSHRRKKPWRWVSLIVRPVATAAGGISDSTTLTGAKYSIADSVGERLAAIVCASDFTEAASADTTSSAAGFRRARVFEC